MRDLRAELEERAIGALHTITDPCSAATGVPIDLVDMGLIRAVTCDGSRAVVELRLTSPTCFQAADIVQRIEAEGRAATGLDVEVRTDFGAEWTPELMAPHSRARLRALRPWPAGTRERERCPESE